MISVGLSRAHLLVLDLLVAVEREVIAAVAAMSAFGTQKLCAVRGRSRSAPSRSSQRVSMSGRLFFACSVSLSSACGRRPELLVGQQRLALVVERQAVGLHVVEPDVIGAADAGLGEHQDRGRDAGIGPEHAGRAA